MYDKDKFIDQNINITIPVVVGYQVLDKYLREKLVGEILFNENKEGEKSNYAQVLDISIEKSYLEGFDFFIEYIFKNTYKSFQKQRGKDIFHAALELDKELQLVSLKDFEVDGKTKNWFADKLLETIVNNWMHEKIKKKMNFDLMPHIERKVGAINKELENKLEAKDGVYLIGALDKVKISNLKAGIEGLWISVSVSGTGLLELEKLEL